MKKFTMLSKAEMKTVIGGIEQCGSDFDCIGGECCSQWGYCGNTPDYCGDSPKIAACTGKKDGDECLWEYQGNVYSGHCRSYMASPLACSTLI